MKNVKEFFNHRLVDYPYYLKCKVCGQDMKIPSLPEKWVQDGPKIEALVEEFREIHNDVHHKKEE